MDFDDELKVTIHCFYVREEPILYDKFLGLMYEVFVAEQSWKIPCDHGEKRVLPNEADLDCFIVLAINEKNKAVSAIKGTTPGCRFSAISLFEEFLSADVIKKHKKTINYLNAVLVSSSYRKREFYLNGSKQTLASHVAKKAISFSKRIGVDLILGATAVFEGAMLIKSNNFRLLSPPSIGHSQYNNTIIMALNVNRNKEIDDYLESRERAVLKSENYRDYVLERLPKISNMDISKINSKRIN
ncbi:hypothetical protein [Alteromonas sp. S015]|uniref:hypothetical protein n=1 Tax=Alteromonas sp. S015 TaxID=3117401 RepID=UPI002FE4195F